MTSEIDAASCIMSGVGTVNCTAELCESNIDCDPFELAWVRVIWQLAKAFIAARVPSGLYRGSDHRHVMHHETAHLTVIKASVEDRLCCIVCSVSKTSQQCVQKVCM